MMMVVTTMVIVMVMVMVVMMVIIIIRTTTSYFQLETFICAECAGVSDYESSGWICVTYGRDEGVQMCVPV